MLSPKSSFASEEGIEKSRQILNLSKPSLVYGEWKSLGIGGA